MGSTVSPAVQTITVGDTVTLKKDQDTLVGIVRFIGPIKNKDGVFYGVELNDPKGQNNGSVAENKSHFYFPKVEDKKGLFIKRKRIQSINYKSNKNAPRVTVGDKVKVIKSDCKINGIIKWIGIPHFSDKGIYYGIQLDKPKGKTNGTVKNKWYFTCEDKHATFVQANGLETLATNQDINSPKKSKVTKLIDLYNEKSRTPPAQDINKPIKSQVEKPPVRRQSVPSKKKSVEKSPVRRKSEQEEILKHIKHLTKTVEGLTSPTQPKTHNTLSVCVICLAVFILIASGAFVALKGYYINDQFETAMECYNFMTFSKPKYFVVDFLILLINYYSKDTFEMKTNNLTEINYPHSYNKIQFSASALGIEELELSDGKSELDGILIAYKCNAETRNEIINFTYGKIHKVSINIDRSVQGKIDIHYLRIFISKTGKNTYLMYYGKARAIYNYDFSHEITDQQIQAIVEKDVAPRFKNDMSQPIWSDIIKQI